MNLQALMQAAPARANELFAKLLETSDGAVKTRDKLFTDLKAELELHISLEEQHLFPVLRRNAETKHLVADAIKDNKELLTKLAEVEKLPKNHETFPNKLRELQKTFRQHARDDKRELLPAVRRALSEVQVQGVAQKMQAGLAEAQQVRHDELEERRIKARQEREQAARLQETDRATKAEAERIRREAAEKRQAAQDAERVKNAEAVRVRQQEAKQQENQQAKRQATQQQAAERATQAEAERIRNKEAEQKQQAAQQQDAERAKQAEAERIRREQAEQKRQEQQAAQQQEAERAQQAEAERIRHAASEQKLVRLEQARAELLAAQQAAVERSKEAALRRADENAEAVARATTAGSANVIQIAENATVGARRVAGEFRGAASSYADVVKTIMPDGRAVASLPARSVRAASEARFMWAEWIGQATRASQDAVWQVVDQQQRFANAMAQGWIEHNARIMQLTLKMADQTVRQAMARSDAAYRRYRNLP